jgi:UDP-glucose 4-epimerase
MKFVVTGGAGFIGSHLSDVLVEKGDVVVFDNFSSGRKDFLKDVGVDIIQGDIRNLSEIKGACKEVDTVYHYAADPDVRRSFSKPLENFRVDAQGTVNVLEACRLNDVKQIVFASSSVVYGNTKIPIPEEAPVAPISNYGAAKATSEYYATTYSQLYGIKATVLRYANIIGPRLTHGIIYDLCLKLKKNPKELEILGDGSQKKSYFHVIDAVDATLLAALKTKKWSVFNVGSEEMITVRKISRLVVSTLDLKGVRYKYTGGRTGWPGDVPIMLLSIEKLKTLGWKPKYSINESILDTIKWLKTHSDQIQ